MESKANINTYVSAKWNVEVCNSNKFGVESSYFPLGKEMKPNQILDIWLESMIELITPDNANVASIGGGLVFSKLTDGYVQLGTGTAPIKNSDTSLHRFFRKTNYIRPGFNRATGQYFPGSGMAIFSRTYDFPPEKENVTYTEAGFEPNVGSLLLDGNRRNKIWSRFLFTQEFLVTGFLSGYLDQNNNFQLPQNEIDIGSGAIVSGRLYNIPPIKTKRYEMITGYRSGFLDQFGNFLFYNQNDPIYKHNYLSGYFINGQKIPLQDRIIEKQFITGFISGYQDDFGNFSGFNIGDTNIGSGYFLNNQEYFFPTGNTFSGFSGENQNEFDNYLGYSYYGFGYSSGSGFSGINNTSSGTGILTGIIGDRNIYKHVGFSGFTGLSGFDAYLGFAFSGFNFPSFGIITNSGNYGSAIMTGLIGYRNILNSSGNASSGFDGIPSFEYGWRYNESGKLFDEQYGSGFIFNTAISGENIIGFRSGITNEFGEFIPFTLSIPNSQGFSGYIISGKKYYFPTGNTFSGFSGMPGFYTGFGFLYSGFFAQQSGFSGESWPVINYEKINGFLSGFKDDLGQFYPFQDIYPELRSSGYFLNNQQYYFSTGNNFSGFSGMFGFSNKTGFAYTGFSFPEGFLFSGLTGSVGTGMITGYIGHRVFYTYPTANMSGVLTGIIGSRNDLFINSNSGIMTGIVGYKKQISGINLITGEFIKLKYEVAMRIPAIINEIPVTGNDIIYGEFNGSGAIKLVGRYENIFGKLSSDGISSSNGFAGFWWPAHNKWTPSPNQIYPNTYLSSVLIGKDHDGILNQVAPPPFPPEDHTLPMSAIKMEDETPLSITKGKYPSGSLSGLPYESLESYIDTRFSQRTSFTLYEFNNIYPNYKKYDKSIDYQFLYLAEFPNIDTDIGGIFFTHTTKVPISKTIGYQPLKPFIFSDWFEKMRGIDLQYVGWYYKLDSYQKKYRDQLINVYITFSVDRETYV